MPKVMIDSSAWVEYFRAREFPLVDQVESLLLEDQVALCGTVEFELLAGARAEERHNIESRFSELAYIEFNRNDHRLAASLSAKMRKQGRTLRYADLLIAAFCMHNELLLLSLDRDFEGLPGLRRLAANRA